MIGSPEHLFPRLTTTSTSDSIELRCVGSPAPLPDFVGDHPGPNTVPCFTCRRATPRIRLWAAGRASDIDVGTQFAVYRRPIYLP